MVDPNKLKTKPDSLLQFAEDTKQFRDGKLRSFSRNLRLEFGAFAQLHTTLRS